MFSKSLSLKHLNYLYLFINLLSYAIILGVIFFVINDCYHLYLKENILFQQTKVSTNSTSHLDVFLKNVLLGMIFGAIKILITLVCVSTIKFLIFKFPVPSSYLINLDKNKEISTILGRYLAYHFRKYQSINFSTLVYLNQEAEYEKYIIQSHSKINKFQYFLKKYDDSYIDDIK